MEKYGYYDESYKKGSDSYFFFTSLGFGNATYRYMDIDVTNFDMHGISSDPKWRQIDKEEDARWYGEHMSERLLTMCKEARQTKRLHDSLHRHKWIWAITCCLLRISEHLTPTKPNVKKEVVK